MTILGGFGIGIITVGAGLVYLSHSIKNHAEKFKADKAVYIKQKLSIELKELIINTISDGVNEFDFLSGLFQSGKNPETKIFENIIIFLVDKQVPGNHNVLLYPVVQPF